MRVGRITKAASSRIPGFRRDLRKMSRPSGIMNTKRFSGKASNIRLSGRSRYASNAAQVGRSTRNAMRPAVRTARAVRNSGPGNLAFSRKGAAAMGVGVLATAVARSQGAGSTKPRGRQTGMYMY